MVDSHESKLDAVLNVIEALTARAEALENLASRIGTSQGSKILQSMQHIPVESPAPLLFQKDNYFNKNFIGSAAKFRGPRVSLLEKFDITLITILQPKSYPTNQS
jgi:hypothetical protein